MNKKLNTMLFMIGATLVNVIMIIVFWILLYLLLMNFLVPILPEGSDKTWIFVLIFIGAIVLSFIAYRALMKFLEKKIDIEKYFDPIFLRRRK